MRVAEAVRESALRQLNASPGNTLGIATKFIAGVPQGVMLVAIARPEWAAVWELPAAQAEVLSLLEELGRMGGFELTLRRSFSGPDIEELRKEKARVAKRR